MFEGGFLVGMWAGGCAECHVTFASIFGEQLTQLGFECLGIRRHIWTCAWCE